MVKPTSPLLSGSATEDYSDYLLDSEEFTSSQRVPWFQWINPSAYTKGEFGLGIKGSLAEEIGFTPDSHWEQKLISFKPAPKQPVAEPEPFFISKNPRLIWLNGNSVISEKIKGNANPFYSTLYVDKKPVGTFPWKKGYTKADGYKTWTYAVLLPVDDENTPLSPPLRLKLSRASILTLKNQYERHFIPEYLKVWQEVTGQKFPAGKTPTASFLARAIFEPKLTEGIQTSGENGEGSPACQANAHTSITPANFTKYALSPKHPTSLIVGEYLKNILDYVKLSAEETDTSTAESHSTEGGLGASATGLAVAGAPDLDDVDIPI